MVTILRVTYYIPCTGNLDIILFPQFCDAPDESVLVYDLLVSRVLGGL